MTEKFAAVLRRRNLLQYYGGKICCSTTAEKIAAVLQRKTILKWGKHKPKYDVGRVPKKIAGEKCECEDFFCRKLSCIIVSL